MMRNMTPLHDAVRSKCTGCVENLLKAGAAVNQTAEIFASAGVTFIPMEDVRYGYEEHDAVLANVSALHLAAAHGCEGCIEVLIDKHANIHAESILADHDVLWDHNSGYRNSTRNNN
ncbi:tauD, partial [Symbiodinium pilosum]